MAHIKSDEFINIALESNLDPYTIRKTIQETNPDYSVSSTQIRQRINNYRRRGLIPLDSGNEVGIGEVLKGTSTLYGADNEIIQQWVKTDVPKQQTLEAFQAALEDIATSIVPTKPVPFTETTNKDYANLLTVYPIGDAHIGMLAHEDETGTNHDLHVVQDVHIAAISQAVAQALPSETAFIVDVGDFLHSDNNDNRTSRGNNPLDVDGRYHKVLRAAFNIATTMINTALTKHKEVHWRSAEGNHNSHSSIVINMYLEAFYKDEPRAIIHTSPNMFFYFHFGKVLLGITHGHTCKADKLGELMSVDCSDTWSTTKYRYWLTGHVHHQSVKEYPACTVETFRTLTSKDAWHSAMGYRSGQDLKTITYHKDYGEIARSTLNIAAIQ